MSAPSGSLTGTESRPGRVCAGAFVTLEVYAGVSSELWWASALRFLWKSRRRAMEDKKQSYLSFIPRCQFIISIDKKGPGKLLIFGVREISKIAFK